MESPICSYCKSEVSQVAVFCENCDFPLSGTEKEKAVFIGQQTMRKSKVESAAKMVKRAQIILYVVAGLQFLNGLLVYVSFNSMFDLVLHFIIGGMLVICSLLMPKKPMLFVSLALGIIVNYYALLYWVDPMYLVNGIIYKVAVIMALMYTLYNVVEVQKLQKKYKL